MYIYSIQTPTPLVENKSEVTKEKTIVSVQDVSNLQGKEKLPVGFPQNIPIEIDSVTESIKTEFPDKGVVQYTVAYTSQASTTDIQKQYETFFETDSFVKKEIDNQVATLVQLHASKDTDDLSVVIEPKVDETNNVYVIFLDRQ